MPSFVRNCLVKSNFLKLAAVLAVLSSISPISFAFNESYNLPLPGSRKLDAGERIFLKAALAATGVDVRNKEIESVQVFARALRGGAEVQLEIGGQPVDSATVGGRERPRRGRDFGRWSPERDYQWITLYNRGDGGESPSWGEPERDRGRRWHDHGDGGSPHRGNGGPVETWQLVALDEVEIAAVTVNLSKTEEAQWSRLESWRPRLGDEDSTEFSVPNGYEPVKAIRLDVDRRNVFITEFWVEFENGRARRIRDLEGRIRQNRSVSFEFRREEGRYIREIKIYGYTERDQGGRADVSISVYHD